MNFVFCLLAQVVSITTIGPGDSITKKGCIALPPRLVCGGHCLFYSHRLCGCNLYKRTSEQLPVESITCTKSHQTGQACEPLEVIQDI